MDGVSGENSILLSASYPSRSYKSHADSHEIAAAVRAIVGAAFQSNWRVVFGGHPTISPLILMIARELGCKNSVTIYQSNYFIHHFSLSTISLIDEGYGDIKVVENHPSEKPPSEDEILDPTQCPRSLSLMRRVMMAHPKTSALLLVGGDSGLQEEFDAFRNTKPDAPIFPIGFPGGLAQELSSANAPEMDPELRSDLSRSRNYLYLCSRIMRYLATRAQ